MKYQEFMKRDRFSDAEVLALSYGTLIEDPPSEGLPRLPAPPMLMVDRITHISRDGRKGRLSAERDVRLDDWFFQCHFLGDPVQPGCLGVDAIWQLLGFFCAWAGGRGAGRALGVGEVDFAGQIRPYNERVSYELEILRFSVLKAAGVAIGIADGRVLVDGEEIYTLKRAKVGVFRDIEYPDYPNRSVHSVGGIMGKT